MIAKDKVKTQMRKKKVKRFTDLAEEMDTTKQTLSNWFVGGQFSSPNLDALVRVLDCTPNDVLAWGKEEERLRAVISQRTRENASE